MSNLIATAQVRRGDYIRVDLDLSHRFLTFTKAAEELPIHEMPKWPDRTMMFQELALANGATAETSNKPIQIASKRQ